MLSTPPAIASDISPVTIPRAATATASMLEAHETVHGHARNAQGEIGQQQRHARHVAIVLAGLRDATVVDLVDRFPIAVGKPSFRAARGCAAKVIGANHRERSSEAPDGRADTLANVGKRHCFLFYEDGWSSSGGDSGTAGIITPLVLRIMASTLSEFRAEQENMRGVIHPQQEHHDRSGSAKRRTRAVVPQVQRDQRHFRSKTEAP